MAVHLEYQFSCIGESQESPTEITSCVFDTTGQRLACAFGDHRVLIFSANGGNNHPIQKWDKTIFRALSSLLSKKPIILQIDWKADGTQLAAGDFNNLFFIFSTVNGNLSSFTEVSDKLTKVQWNRRGSVDLLLTSCDDGTVTVWDSSEQPISLLQTFSFHTSSVRDIQWLTKETFASCSMDGSIHVCRVGADESLHSLFNENSVLAIRYNVKHDSLAFFSYDTNVKLWLLEQDCIREWEGHNAAIYSICWNECEDFTMLASGGDDRTVQIWNTSSSLCKSQEVLREHCWLVSAVSFSPDGNFLASADTNGIVIIWSTQDWSLLTRHQCSGTVLEINSLRWNPQSTKLVVTNQSAMMSIIEWTSECDSACSERL